MADDALKIPIEFKNIARNIGMETFEFANSMSELVAFALIGVDENQAAILRPFLAALLAENRPADELSAFWSLLPSEIYIKDGESVRKFLEALLVALERAPDQGAVLGK